MEPADHAAIQRLRRWAASHLGLVFPDANLAVLGAKLRRALPALEVASIDALATAVVDRGAPLTQPLISALTVGETFFFRNRAQFDALRDKLLPDLVDGAGSSARLSIWSAGCATGEEPYSLGIWLKEHTPSLWPKRVRIVATDINPAFLDQAKTARYRPWSFRQIDPDIQRRYFATDGDRLILDPHIREAVHFAEHNLSSGLPPPGLRAGEVDLILCRNLLIYFHREAAERALELFARTLRPDGYLLLGHAESFTALRRWRLSYAPGTFFYQPPQPGGAPTTPRLPAVPPALFPNATPRPDRRRPAPRPRPLCPRPAPSSEAGQRSSPEDRTTTLSTVELLEAARTAADAGSLDEARLLLRAHQERDPASFESLILRALVEEQQGNLEGARGALKRALFLEKGAALGHYLLGVLDERVGDDTAAVRRYRSARRLLRGAVEDAVLPMSDGLTAGQLRELATARIVELVPASRGSEGNAHG